MIFNKRNAILCTAVGLTLGACNFSPTVTTYLVSGRGTDPTAATTGPNTMQVSINGSLCSNEAYPNMPCVSLKLCVPGSTICQVISHILLDTGSTGLRIFKSVVAISLPTIPVAGGTLADCQNNGDLSVDWGPVAMASVALGGEPTISIPIQLIDSKFGDSGASCLNAQDDGSATYALETDPIQTGFNGILGIGNPMRDCGANCTSDPNVGLYYACTGTSCTGATASLSQQVGNPVAFLPTDNNGTIVSIPAIPHPGLTSTTGVVIFGIGTQSNNIPASSVVTLLADPDPSSTNFGNFQTSFAGMSSPGFFDTGSNTLTPSTVPTAKTFPDCRQLDPTFQGGYLCPSSFMSLSAINSSYDASTNSTLFFTIGNAGALLAGGTNKVFDALASTPQQSAQSGTRFEWGLPSYFGRTIYHGFEQSRSSLGKGTYWAY